MNLETKPKCFIIDVDGIITNCHFHYTFDGKVMKVFGHDGFGSNFFL